MSNDTFFKKQETSVLQGIAVFLMVFHHLFNFPDRISLPYELVFNIGFFNFDTLLANFGKICVGIFAFCSGYGMWLKASTVSDYNILKGYKVTFSSMLRFFSRYWFVFLVFIPIGFFMGVYQFDFYVFIKSIIGIDCSYNAEWWYVKNWVQYSLLFPLVFIVSNKIPRTKQRLCNAIFVVLIFVITACSVAGVYTIKDPYFWCFLMGTFIASNGIFDKMFALFPKKDLFSSAVSWFILAVVFVLRVKFTGNIYDYLVVPVFAFAIGILLKNSLLKSLIKAIFGYLGKYSTYVWLTHTFFAYYYFQVYLYKLYYSPFILVACLAMSVFSGMLLEFLKSLCEKVFIKRKRI